LPLRDKYMLFARRRLTAISHLGSLVKNAASKSNQHVDWTANFHPILTPAVVVVVSLPLLP